MKPTMKLKTKKNKFARIEIVRCEIEPFLCPILKETKHK